MIHLVFGEKQKRDTAKRESIEEIANVEGTMELQKRIQSELLIYVDNNNSMRVAQKQKYIIHMYVSKYLCTNKYVCRYVALWQP